MGWEVEGLEVVVVFGEVERKCKMASCVVRIGCVRFISRDA